MGTLQRAGARLRATTDAATLAERDDRPQEDHFVHLRGVTWADYQRLLEIRGDRSAPRITYLEGTLEIRTPSRHHQSIKSVIGCLVEVWCLEHDVDFGTYGSWTLDSEKEDRGAEPDECYVFGTVQEPERPDLAIEVVWTSGGIDKLEVYRKLGVREVWYWRRGRIQPYEFMGVILIGSRGGDFVEASLYGRVPSRSPVADVGPDRTIECASPAGTPVALSAAGSSDPDGFGDIASFVWAARLPGGTERPVPGGGVDVESAAPLGRTVFRVTATDTHGIGDVDSAAVFVEDTTPPRFDQVDVATDCLWKPDHRMHLLRLDEEIIAEVTDRCAGEIRDVRIVDAFSNEPVDGIGDGSTAPDVRFGSAAVCLRSEREGGHPDGRGYTVVLEARDGNGNVQRHQVRIDVPHDQRPASRCRTGALAPVVAVGDPRCEMDVATASTVVAMPAVGRDAENPRPSEGPEGNGCTASAAGRLNPGMLALFALCATVACRRRRTRKAGQGRS